MDASKSVRRRADDEANVRDARRLRATSPSTLTTPSSEGQTNAPARGVEDA